MRRITIPTAGWTIALADAIEGAKHGDVIEVHNQEMFELAEDFRRKLHPAKSLKFEITPPPLPFGSGSDG